MGFRQGPKAMSKTARSCHASPTEAGSEQRLAILPWRFEPYLVASGQSYWRLLVAGSAIAAGLKRMRFRIRHEARRKRHAPARVQIYRRMPSFSIKPL
jgi:hypothetical protein